MRTYMVIRYQSEKFDFVGWSEEGHVVGFDRCHSAVADGNSGRQHAECDDDGGENGETNESAARRRHVLAHLHVHARKTHTV